MAENTLILNIKGEVKKLFKEAYQGVYVEVYKLFSKKFTDIKY